MLSRSNVLRRTVITLIITTLLSRCTFFYKIPFFSGKRGSSMQQGRRLRDSFSFVCNIIFFIAWLACYVAFLVKISKKNMVVFSSNFHINSSFDEKLNSFLNNCRYQSLSKRFCWVSTRWNAFSLKLSNVAAAFWKSTYSFWKNSAQSDSNWSEFLKGQSRQMMDVISGSLN